jgi:hypothetical protein
MLIFRKQTRKQKDPFSIFPSLNTSIFYDVSKNSEHINTFRGARLKSHPSKKFQKFNFLEQKESQRPKWTSFHIFSIMANWNLLPKSHRKMIIWSNPFKPFKDTISKTNTCFRQHHDFLKENFSKRFRNKWLKHINHTTRQNSWSYVTIRELQAQKHNHASATKRLCERQV